MFSMILKFIVVDNLTEPRSNSAQLHGKNRHSGGQQPSVIRGGSRILEKGGGSES